MKNMIEVGNIVTLENDLEYLILEDLVLDSKKYVYTVRTLKDETPTDEFLIFEVLTNSDGEYVKPVNDKVLYDNLIEKFKDIVADKVLNGDYDEMVSDDDFEEAA